MSSAFFLVAPKLRALGYSVIPLRAHSKAPALEKWQEYGVNTADDATFARWMRWTDIGIGVACGVGSNVVGVDYDHDVDGLHAIIKSILPESPIAKAGQKGETRFYQFNGEQSKGFNKNKLRIIDILSTGRQTVLPPTIHPDTQQPYRWLTEKTLENTPASELPHIPAQAIYEISSLFKTEPIHHVPTTHYATTYEDTPFEDVGDALEYIPSDDYDAWIRIGMCLKDKFGEKGFSLWDKWSSTSEKYNAREIRSKWNSFRGQGLTIASLFYMAMDNGFTCIPTDYLDPVHEDFILNGKRTGVYSSSENSSPPTPAAAIILPEEPVRKTDQMTFPVELLKAPGLPGIIANLINKTSLMPQPVLALAAALAASGSLMGRKVRGDTNIRTNMYVLGLAPSGSGKDHARTVIKRMLHDTGLGNIEFGVPASSAGLVSSLRENGEGRGLILWDEFGRMLKQITSFKAGTHERDIVTAMIELFSSSQSIYMGKAYANHDGKKPPKPIDQPCLSIYATSVPSHFYDALSGSEAIDGFLSRWLLFESRDYNMEEEEREEAFAEIPQLIVDLCKQWKEMPFNSEPGNGNLADVTRVVPKLIKCSAPASALLKNFATETRKLAMKQELAKELTGSIWSRAGEHARRLALVGCEGDVIELKVADWAVKMTNYCCQYMAYAIGDYVSSSELEAQTKRLLRYLKDKKSVNDGWISRADISRSFQGVQSRTRLEILGSLVERGEVAEERLSNTKGRPSLRYRAL